MAIMRPQDEDEWKARAELSRCYIMGEMSPHEVAEFRRKTPAHEGARLEELRIAHITAVEAEKREKVRSDLIKECTEPCPNDKDSREWYARRTNLLLAAILERMP